MDLEHPNAELLLRAYARGIFPMADPRTGKLDYYSPDPRAVLPLDDFHVPKSLARVAKSGVFELRSDTAFERALEQGEVTLPRDLHAAEARQVRSLELRVEQAEAACSHPLDQLEQAQL